MNWHYRAINAIDNCKGQFGPVFKARA